MQTIAAYVGDALMAFVANHKGKAPFSIFPYINKHFTLRNQFIGGRSFSHAERPVMPPRFDIVAGSCYKDRKICVYGKL